MFSLPVRRGEHRGQVGYGRVARHMQPIGIPAEPLGVAVYPRHRSAQLIDERKQAVADVLHPAEFGHDVMNAGIDEQLCRKAI